MLATSGLVTFGLVVGNQRRRQRPSGSRRYALAGKLACQLASWLTTLCELIHLNDFH